MSEWIDLEGPDFPEPVRAMHDELETRGRSQAMLVMALVMALIVALGCAPGCDALGDRRQQAPAEEPAHAVDPQQERVVARLRMAQTLLDEGQIEAAIEQLRRLPSTPEHRIAPGNEPRWLGSILERLLKRREAALAESLLALTGPVAGRSPELQALTANLQVMTGNLEAAVGTYAGIRTSDPALQVRVLHELATLHLARDEGEAALERAREGIVLAADHQRLRIVAAQALRRMGQPERALQELRSMNESAARWAAEAEIYLEVLDRPDTAAILLSRALSIVPKDPAFRQMLAKSWIETGKPERAIPMLQPLASARVPYGESQRLLARAYRARGRTAAADSILAIVSSEEELARVQELRVEGLRYSYGGESARALERFDAALALAPREGELHNDRGTVLAQMERWGDAEAAFLRAAELQPSDPTPIENLARLYARTGDDAARDRAVAEALARRAAVDSAQADPR